jgi:hypothetical protein
MMQILYVGAILGFGLYLSKLFLFWLLAPKFLKHWISSSNFLLGVFDIALGLLSAKALSMADGTIAMAASITFGVCSMLYITCKIGIRRTTQEVRRICTT